MKFTRKGQMEIIGLVIIVILIAVAMIFFIQFSLTKEPSQSRETFTRKLMARSTNNAIFESMTTCGVAFSELYKDCASGGGLGYNCGMDNTCVYVEKEVASILNQTLAQWNNDYQFKIYVGDQTKVNIVQGDCLNSKDEGTNYVRSQGSLVYINLKVCKK
ncbi:hypothetical protein ACFLZB_01660 [Nanoarchaeota archaeon]